MTNPTSLYRLVAWAVFALLATLAGQARAQADIPSTDDECLNDHAKVVGKKDKAAIQALCRKASKDKVTMMTVIIESLDDFQPRPLSVDRFADSIFDDLDVEYEEGGDVMMLFVSLKENEFRILLGERYTDRQRKKAGSIIRSTLVQDFRRKKRSRGIRRSLGRLFNEVVRPHIRELKKAKKKSSR